MFILDIIMLKIGFIEFAVPHRWIGIIRAIPPSNKNPKKHYTYIKHVNCLLGSHDLHLLNVLLQIFKLN